MAQKRKTTLAAETIGPASAGSVTVRKTWPGEAPSAAAASPGRGSRLSQAVPTVRTTTARLKNASAAMIAAGGAVEAEPGQRAAGAEHLAERDPDHDGRQHERHQQRGAQHPLAGEPQPVEHVRGRHPEQHRERGCRRPPTRA